MKKRLWKLAIILVVLGLAGCQNATQADNPGNVITKQPEATATPEPTDIPISNVEVTKEAEATVTPAPTSTPTPEATKEPEATATPEPEVEPTNTPEPEATKESEATVTPEPTNTPIPKPTVTPKEDNPQVSKKGCTGILLSLPEDEGNRWGDAWSDSETNERIVYKSETLPKNGKVSVKFCYPKAINPENRSDMFELFFNDSGMEFSIRDAVGTGVLGEEWIYYEAEGDYTTSGSELEILIKTHSESGSKGILFAIADIKITDTKTGKSAKVDLTSNEVDIVCTEGYFRVGKEIEFELFRMSTEPVSTVTPAPTMTPAPTVTPNIAELKKSTGVVITLPDDSKYLWENVWTESETNIQIEIPGGDIPKEGAISIKLCYPNEVDMSSRKEQYEVIINGEGTFFSEIDCSRNNMNNTWTYLEFKRDYINQGNALNIMLKTHSESGSKGTIFGLADLIILDKNGNVVRNVDLTQDDVTINCSKYSYSSDWMMGCVYEVRKMWDDIIVISTGDISKWEDVVRQEKYEKDSKLYGLTYKLPESETPWGTPWTDSEANMNFQYVSESPLNGGTISATLCIPVLRGKNRIDEFELTVHAVDNFVNYTADNAKISYKGDKVYLYDTEIYPENGYYKIEFEVEYDRDKIGNGNELHFALKSHCNEYLDAYEVTWCDIMVEDRTGGAVALDLTASNVSLEGEMYANGKRVLYTLSNTMFDFYIKNKIGRLIEGASYVLDIYTSEPAQISFESTDSDVVSVDKNGKMTAHKVGTCEIRVTNEETRECESFTVTVSTPQLVFVDYEKLMLTGTETKIEVTTEFVDKGGKYTYASSDTRIASIDSSGVITAKKSGIVTITVEDVTNNIKQTYELEVYTPNDTEGIAQYLSIKNTDYVTADIAKRSYELLYDVYKNVFDYFNYGEYEEVTLIFTVNDYSPAYSDAMDIYLASEHMLANAKDVDCITHELIHCAQNHISVGDDVWLMEGLTDYGRYLFGLHNEDCGWALSEYDASQHYTNSYTVTAAFIKFVTDNYCADMPHIINKMFKGPDGYDESIWKENTGYTIDELWELYAES